MKPFTVTTRLLKDVDLRVFDDLKKRFIGARVVKVGWPQGKAEADGTPLAMIAAVHEFGDPERGIPERSSLRSSMQENAQKYVRLNKLNLVSILRGGLTADEALGQLGEMAKSDVQVKIRSGDFVPLKPATVARKGSSKPLIDSGQLVQGVSYEVGGEE